MCAYSGCTCACVRNTKKQHSDVLCNCWCKNAMGADCSLSSAVQRIYPEVSFTCSGNIQSWVFGGQWEGEQWGGSIGLFIELQISS